MQSLYSLYMRFAFFSQVTRYAGFVSRLANPRYFRHSFTDGATKPAASLAILIRSPRLFAMNRIPDGSILFRKDARLWETESRLFRESLR